MAAKITFFQVGNGDMTLLRLADTRVTTVLIDINIRAAAADPDDDTPDVVQALRKRLIKDKDGRPFVDAFLLSHPDQDHCRGLISHFWLGDPSDYPDDDLDQDKKRILIRELWSSPLIFRRRSKNHTLCKDAQAFDKEARRRVEYWCTYRSAASGNRIRIMGEDVKGKTDNLGSIVTKAGTKFSSIDGEDYSTFFTAHLLGPVPHDDDEKLEEQLGKNESSVVMSIDISQSMFSNSKARFLTGGDAAVLIWERMWNRFKETPEVLEYDLLQAPHHCSWRTLSYDSWSDNGEKARLNEGARNALGQARDGATIVSSSKEILDDDVDPPNIRARREYKDILKANNGWFGCTGDLLDEPVLEFTVESGGKVKKVGVAAALAGTAGSSVGAVAAPRAGIEK